MKANSLLFTLLVGISAPCVWGVTDARPSEVRIELSSDKTVYATYEPVLIHFKATYLGNYETSEVYPELERVVRFEFNPIWVNGPFKGPFKGPATIGVERVNGCEEARLLPGDCLEVDFWLSPSFRLALFPDPGEYEVWIGPQEWAQPLSRYESNHLKITVREPEGVDREALAFAKEGHYLLSLMAGSDGFREPKDRKLFGLSSKELGTKSSVPVWANFVASYPNSVYHPYVLFSLCTLYYQGYAETRKKGHYQAIGYTHEPDYELLLKSSDLFLEAYPNHPLAYEVHYYRFAALLGLGKRKEAEKELAAIRAFRKPLDERAIAGGYQPNIREDLLAKENIKYLYILTNTQKLLDLWDKGLLDGQPRRTTAKRPQADELQRVFSTRWMVSLH